jgi:hypothetical protein
MHSLEQLDEDDGGTVFRDVIMLALAGFVAMVILLLPHLNPPGQAAEQTTEPPGNVIVELRWPDELDSDVDLWVEAPGDTPVGYSNKGGAIFNLLRDDLGKRADATGLNYEVSYSRGIPEGEYTVNVHLYRNAANVFPIPVTVVTSVKTSPKESARQPAADSPDTRLRRPAGPDTSRRAARARCGAVSRRSTRVAWRAGIAPWSRG